MMRPAKYDLLNHTYDECLAQTQEQQEQQELSREDYPALRPLPPLPQGSDALSTGVFIAEKFLDILVALDKDRKSKMTAVGAVAALPPAVREYAYSRVKDALHDVLFAGHHIGYVTSELLICTPYLAANGVTAVAHARALLEEDD